MSITVSRRDVIRTFALATVLLSVSKGNSIGAFLARIQPRSEVNTGLLRIDLVSFPELDQPVSSVRLGTSAMNVQGEKQLGLFPPVLINRAADGLLYVLSAACTHEGCSVRRVDPNSGLMACPCHGSVYTPTGQVVQGPAQQSLLPLRWIQRGTILEIELPDVFFEIDIQRLNNSERVKLSFIAFDKITYEIHFRRTLSDSPKLVSFSRTETGPLTETELQVVDDYANAYVHREGASGFYQIVMKTMPV